MTERAKDFGVIADKIFISSGDIPQPKPKPKGKPMLKLITMTNESEVETSKKTFPATERVQKVVSKGLANGKFKVQRMRAKDEGVIVATCKAFWLQHRSILKKEYKDLDLKLTQASIRSEMIEYIFASLESFESKLPYGPIQINRVLKKYDFA